MTWVRRFLRRREPDHPTDAPVIHEPPPLRSLELEWARGLLATAEREERQRNCKHEDTVEITSYGDLSNSKHLCQRCSLIITEEW